MWGNFPELNSGVAAKILVPGSAYHISALDVARKKDLRERRKGDRLRWERLRAYINEEPASDAATGELGEFAGASEIRCALFCDPATIAIEAVPEAARSW